MATTNTVPAAVQTERSTASLLISSATLSQDATAALLDRLEAAFPEENVLFATPDPSATSTRKGNGRGMIEVVGYSPAASSSTTWTLTPADFLNAHELARHYGSRAVLQLGAEAQSLEPAALHALAGAVLTGGSDLAVAGYALPARTGLVNSAILYPLTRALFGTRPRFPLAIDLCLSSRMSARLATNAQRYTAANQMDALLWPLGEAAVAGFSIAEVEVGPRTLPQPDLADLNALLAHVTSSLFADMDAKAAFWQRARPAQTMRAPKAGPESPAASIDEIQPLLDAFHLAYGNLHEIWSLVLPPQSLLGLKRLSILSAETFRMPDSLWARIVYDFLLAYRLRTINRGHLLGALTPLYLAWVASHLLLSAGGNATSSEVHIEAVAGAFEADKPYLVSRWRWPDRFNP